VLGGPRSVFEPGLPSHEVAAPCRVFNLESLAPALVRRSPLALRRFRPGYRVFTFQVPRYNRLFLGILSWASAPLQRLPKHLAAASRSWGLPKPRRPDELSTFSSASLEVLTPSAFLCPGKRHPGQAYLAQPPAPSGSHNLLTPSSAPSLPALFHAGSALGVHPPELCSSRAVVRCFQRRSPLGVPAAYRVLLHARVRHSTQRFRLNASA